MECLRINSGSLFSLSSPIVKWSLTVLTVTALAGGILGSAYMVCGLTPLAHSWKILLPLQNIDKVILGVSLAGGACLSVVLGLFLVFVHKKHSNPHQTPEILASLDEMAEHLPHDPHFMAIRKFLTEGYFNYLEYYGFYYHLSCLTEAFRDDPKKMGLWKNFLTQIHGFKVANQNENVFATVDCSIEFGRLENKLPPIKIEKLDRTSLSAEEDLATLHGIFCEAFPNWRRFTGNEVLHPYFFAPFCTLYVLRNPDNNGEVLGCIMLEEQKQKNGETHLYIHSLARKAPATKIHMTEKLKDFFLEQVDASSYEKVWCEVLIKNLPAQSIYKKLGFKETERNSQRIVMVYQK